MIKIICVGKIKEVFYRDAINEYLKRLSKYEKVEIIECKDYADLPINDIMLKEATEIEKHINPKDYVITMEIEGKQISSIELANKINDIYLISSNIVFIIGGSYGLHDNIKNRSNYR